MTDPILAALSELEKYDDCRDLIAAARAAYAARAALSADGPAVPEGREPASVVGEPSDAELLGLDQLEAAWNAQSDAANGWDELGLDEIIVWAQRQALARWGYHPAPPAEGEAMRRLIDAPIDARWYVDLRNAPTPPAEGEVQPQELPDDFIGHERGFAQEHLARLMRDAIGTETDHSAYIVAAGKILDRPEFALVASRHPAPVPVSERLPGPDDCDAEGRCWCWNPPTYAASPGWWTHEPLEWVDDATHWLPATALPLPAGEPQP